MRGRLAIDAKFVLVAVLLLAAGRAHAEGPGAFPPARKVPGISAEDVFPRACVSCHAVVPQKDARLSTFMKQAEVAVEPGLLAKAQAAAPSGVTLKGKHPSLGASMGAVPGSCLKCHGKDSRHAPPFARLLHLVHLEGGEQNHFMTLFQGECTHCHKLDAKTGVWSVPSVREP